MLELLSFNTRFCLVRTDVLLSQGHGSKKQSLIIARPSLLLFLSVQLAVCQQMVLWMSPFTMLCAGNPLIVSASSTQCGNYIDKSFCILRLITLFMNVSQFLYCQSFLSSYKADVLPLGLWSVTVISVAIHLDHITCKHKLAVMHLNESFTWHCKVSDYCTGAINCIKRGRESNNYCCMFVSSWKNNSYNCQLNYTLH